MIGWLGTFALAVGLSSAVASTALWFRAAVGGDTLRPARWAVVAMLAGAGCAVAVVEWALVTHDFSLRFVAENGSVVTPLYYTVTSLWAAHDGSLLLWLLVLTGYVAVVGLRPPPRLRDLHPWAMGVLSVVAAFFFGLMMFGSDAFQTVSPAPATGPGPNPLLQDNPAMGVHPPLLYAGYVGLSVPFAFALAGLVTGDVRRHWLTALRRYTLVAWVALTAGIVLGAWWSYAVLGWGGYWAWDPVENASLMPWLVATALLHSSMVQRHRGALPAWNVALAITGFLLACLGTLLTRSGAVTSVHAFAESGVGPVLLGFVVALAAGVTALVLVRADRLSAPRSSGPLLSRGTALLLNNVLLGCLTVTVLLGTLFPLVAETVNGSRLSVGPPYYNRMAVPLAMALLVLMAVGPLMRWREEDPARLLRLVRTPVLTAAGVVTVLVVSGVHPGMALAVFGLAAMVATTVLREWLLGAGQALAGRSTGRARTLGRWLQAHRRRNAGLLAHLGVVVVMVGIAASSAYTVASEHRVRVGGQVSTAGVTARLDRIERRHSARDMSTAARLTLHGHGTRGTATTAALRYFPAHQMTVAGPAIISGATGDVYLTLLSVNQAGTAATLRLAVNPMVGWIWAGGAITVLGGVCALWPRRRPVAALAIEETSPVTEAEAEPEVVTL